MPDKTLTAEMREEIREVIREEKEFGDIARKTDVEKLRVEIEKLRGEMKEQNEKLRGEMKEQNEKLRGEMKEQNEKLRGDMYKLIQRQTVWVIIAIGIAISAATALSKLL